jgi:hypothetical protein
VKEESGYVAPSAVVGFGKWGTSYRKIERSQEKAKGWISG